MLLTKLFFVQIFLRNTLGRRWSHLSSNAACVLLLTFVFVFAYFPPVFGGAFLPPEGHGILIESFDFIRADRAYGPNGRNFPIPSWRKYELTTYGEYGLNDFLTLAGQGSWLSYQKPSVPADSKQTFAPAFAGLRFKLWNNDDSIVSFQASGLFSFNRQADWIYFNMNSRAQADLRLGFGKALQIDGFDSFIDAQAAFRTNGGAGSEIHIDLTWGGRLTPSVMLLLQSFTMISPQDPQKQCALDQKFRVSLVYEFTDGVSMQFGGVLSGPGQKSSEERGLFSAVWYKF